MRQYVTEVFLFHFPLCLLLFNIFNLFLSLWLVCYVCVPQDDDEDEKDKGEAASDGAAKTKKKKKKKKKAGEEGGATDQVTANEKTLFLFSLSTCWKAIYSIFQSSTWILTWSRGHM